MISIRAWHNAVPHFPSVQTRDSLNPLLAHAAKPREGSLGITSRQQLNLYISGRPWLTSSALPQEDISLKVALIHRRLAHEAYQVLFREGSYDLSVEVLSRSDPEKGVV